MDLFFDWNGTRYSIDRNDPVHISIRLEDGFENQPNAYGAPLYETSPVKSGDFTGSLEAGSPVNFYNIRLNPHGNGTHTECIGHIRKGEHFVHDELKEVFTVAELITVFPELQAGGDRVISRRLLEEFVQHSAEALIIRTLPNEADKRTRKYTGTNPPYLDAGAMEYIVANGVRHLLVDLPSVDPESDGGALKAHKIFWGQPENPVVSRTITEMIFVDNSVEDGLYLLTLQIAPLKLDASPSRPILFRMNPSQ